MGRLGKEAFGNWERGKGGGRRRRRRRRRVAGCQRPPTDALVWGYPPSSSFFGQANSAFSSFGYVGYVCAPPPPPSPSAFRAYSTVAANRLRKLSHSGRACVPSKKGAIAKRKLQMGPFSPSLSQATVTNCLAAARVGDLGWS